MTVTTMEAMVNQYVGTHQAAETLDKSSLQFQIF